MRTKAIDRTDETPIEPVVLELETLSEITNLHVDHFREWLKFGYIKAKHFTACDAAAGGQEKEIAAWNVAPEGLLTNGVFKPERHTQSARATFAAFWSGPGGEARLTGQQARVEVTLLSRGMPAGWSGGCPDIEPLKRINRS